MALSRHHAAISRPLSIEEIVHQAQEFDFPTNRPLKAWFRSAQLLLTESAICEQDGDIQMAYLYLYRHAELVLGKFPLHPEYKDPRYKADLLRAQKTVQKNLVKLEQWKPRIKHDHQRYLRSTERRNAEKQRIHEERENDERQRLSHEERRPTSAGSDESAYNDALHDLNANENRQLAVDLAHREIRRRDASKRSTRQAGISPGTIASRRRGMVMNDADQVDAGDRPSEGYDGLSKGIREAGRRVDAYSRQPSRQSETHQARTTTTYYKYPSVPTKEATIEWRTSTSQPRLRDADMSSAPLVPRKDALGDRVSSRDLYAPPLPPKAIDDAMLGPPGTSTSPPLLSQTPPSKYTFKPSAFTESGRPLRPVLLPPELRTTFLNLAHKNTLRNLETCGILCGTLISNALFINHLVIPDQQSTSDTCDTTEEGDNELFDFCDSNELLVCGWIHTHPTQSCFLSSRDLHTSSGYQVMLPEAIAIVCAPRQNPDWGIFRLTDPPGLNHVLNCNQRGLFHPHSENNLYTDALKPGHVVEGPGLQFEVVDLRKP